MLTVFAGAAALRLSDSRLLTVQTASMVPTFRPGDALVITPLSQSDLKAGQIVSYHSPRNPNLTITHRLVAAGPKPGWLTTAGDAYQTADPSFPKSLLIGRVRWLLPGLGGFLDSLHKPAALALGVYLPALTLVMAELHRLYCSYTRPIYS